MLHFHKVHTFLLKKAGIFKNAGSAAIILSLIVSGSVLSTIFISQKSANWFLSAQDESIEGWERAFVSQTAMAIGGYLIANNLVLCKEGGWENYDAKCKWNSNSSKKLNEFNLSGKKVLDINGSKVLSFKGTVDEDVINNPQSDAGDIDYRITFDLVNWKKTSVQNLIGEIPHSVCRNRITMSMRDGNCPLPKVDKCKDSSNVDIPNSVCEYISEHDQDYTIVLISVQVPFNKTSVTTNTVYAGVRRPLSMPLVAILPPGPICRLACVGSATTSLPECRGEFTPPSGDNLQDIRVKVTNPGPGSIYSLSLLRRDIYHTGDGAIKYKSTGELLEQVNKEVLLPGEHLIFQDFVDCEDSVTRTFSTRTIRQTRIVLGTGGTTVTSASVANTDVNVHTQSFMQMNYGLFSMTKPIGACMAFDTVESMMKSVEGTPTCPNKYSSGQACGNGGKCYYSNIEPNRYSIAGEGEAFSIDVTHINFDTTITETIVTTILQSPPGGGGGAGGSGPH